MGEKVVLSLLVPTVRGDLGDRINPFRNRTQLNDREPSLQRLEPEPDRLRASFLQADFVFSHSAQKFDFTLDLQNGKTDKTAHRKADKS